MIKAEAMEPYPSDVLRPPLLGSWVTLSKGQSVYLYLDGGEMRGLRVYYNPYSRSIIETQLPSIGDHSYDTPRSRATSRRRLLVDV